ncbi:MAG: hypothetical protein RL411_524 [Bacteroidota bacterium]|jgi:hypothetical protein
MGINAKFRKGIFTRIEGWLLLFFLIQCIGITDPPLEIGHNWRQVLTNMVSRNYYESGMDWLYPRIDIAGEKSGITGAEFPIMNFLIFLCFKAFGFAHWYGRLINLLMVVWGVFRFHKMTKVLFDERVANYAASSLMASVWFSISRKIMPDTFAVSLVIIGLSYWVQYCIEIRFKDWILGVIFICLGVLSKIPSACLVAALLPMVWMNQIQQKTKILIFMGAFLSMLPAILWYFHWVPYINTFGYPWFISKGLVEGIREILPLWRLLLEKFYFTSFYSFLALAAMIYGIVVCAVKRDKAFWIGVASVTLVFVFYMVKTGSVFPQHTYYVIPFVPVMCLFVGFGLSSLTRFRFGNKLPNALIFLIILEGVSNQMHDHFIKKSEMYKLTLASEVSHHIPKSDLVIINSGVNPQELYFLHRKGWVALNEQVLDINQMNAWIKKGAKYLVFNKSSFKNWVTLDIIESSVTPNFEMVFENEHYALYKLPSDHIE